MFLRVANRSEHFRVKSWWTIASLHAGFKGMSGANMAASLQRQQGRQGTLEIYATPGLTITCVIGPVTDLSPGWVRAAGKGDSSRRPAQPNGRQRAKRGANSAAVQLGSVEGGMAVAFQMDVIRALEAGPVYVQVRHSQHSFVERQRRLHTIPCQHHSKICLSSKEVMTNDWPV